MKKFTGFPDRMRFTPVPDLFLNTLMPVIEDPAELKITLLIMELLYQKRGSPVFLTHDELRGSPAVMSSLKTEEKLCQALAAAVERGTLLKAGLQNAEEQSQDVYFLNNSAGRQVFKKIESGEFTGAGLKMVKPADAGQPLPDIFTDYEQNIGIITPIIAEELSEAENNYPAVWIHQAIRQAVSLNKRNWRYIQKILENWTAEGKSDGTYRGNIAEGPEKFTGQKYGHMVKR